MFPHIVILPATLCHLKKSFFLQLILQNRRRRRRAFPKLGKTTKPQGSGAKRLMQLSQTISTGALLSLSSLSQTPPSPCQSVEGGAPHEPSHKNHQHILSTAKECSNCYLTVTTFKIYIHILALYFLPIIFFSTHLGQS